MVVVGRPASNGQLPDGQNAERQPAHATQRSVRVNWAANRHGFSKNAVSPAAKPSQRVIRRPKGTRNDLSLHPASQRKRSGSRAAGSVPSRNRATLASPVQCERTIGVRLQSFARARQPRTTKRAEDPQRLSPTKPTQDLFGIPEGKPSRRRGILDIRTR